MHNTLWQFNVGIRFFPFIDSSMIIPTIFPRTNSHDISHIWLISPICRWLTYRSKMAIFGGFFGRISHGSRDTRRRGNVGKVTWRPPIGWWMATWLARIYWGTAGWKKRGFLRKTMTGWWWLEHEWIMIFHILGIPPSSYLLKPDHDFFFRSWRELSKLATFWTWFQTWINHRNVSRFFITVSKRLTTPVQWGSPIWVCLKMLG